MKSKILIIEDVKEMSDLVAMYLSKEGMEIEQCETAENALEKIDKWEPDLIVLDLNLPGMDGFEFLHQYRKKSLKPVIIVSARDADEDIITGLGYGADEFVTKPFSPKVLVARVRALIRRAQDQSSTEDMSMQISFGNYVLDLNSFVLKKKKEDGKFERIMLSAKEYGVLELFVKNPNKPLSPDFIYNTVWNNAYGDLSAVAVYVQRLRRKIEKNPETPEFIETVFGMGYRFNLV